LARAKNTQRAAARRRYRDQVRVNTLSDDAFDQPTEDEESSSPPAKATSRPAPGGTGVGSMFRRPDVRGDLAAMPELLRTQRKLWIPFLILAAAFVFVALVQVGVLSADLAPAETLVAQLTLVPTSLFIPFIAGFLAPRGSYILGGLVGLVQSILLIILISLPVSTDSGTASLLTGSDIVSAAIQITVLTVPFGILAAGFASWYRSFLRNSQQRAQANRVLRDQQAAAKRKEEERKTRAAERDARRTASPKKSAP
jgi:hypothetical protein